MTFLSEGSLTNLHQTVLWEKFMIFNHGTNES